MLRIIYIKLYIINFIFAKISIEISLLINSSDLLTVISFNS